MDYITGSSTSSGNYLPVDGQVNHFIPGADHQPNNSFDPPEELQRQAAVTSTAYSSFFHPHHLLLQHDSSAPSSAGSGYSSLFSSGNYNHHGAAANHGFPGSSANYGGGTPFFQSSGIQLQGIHLRVWPLDRSLIWFPYRQFRRLSNVFRSWIALIKSNWIFRRRCSIQQSSWFTWIIDISFIGGLTVRCRSQYFGNFFILPSSIRNCYRIFQFFSSTTSSRTSTISK